MAISFITFVLPSTWNNSPPTGRIFVALFVKGLLKSVANFRFGWNLIIVIVTYVEICVHLWVLWL
jgi:hypothetical protein